jgi:hypothetical protein
MPKLHLLSSLATTAQQLSEQGLSGAMSFTLLVRMWPVPPLMLPGILTRTSSHKMQGLKGPTRTLGVH